MDGCGAEQTYLAWEEKAAGGRIWGSIESDPSPKTTSCTKTLSPTLHSFLHHFDPPPPLFFFWPTIPWAFLTLQFSPHPQESAILVSFLFIEISPLFHQPSDHFSPFIIWWGQWRRINNGNLMIKVTTPYTHTHKSRLITEALFTCKQSLKMWMFLIIKILTN